MKSRIFLLIACALLITFGVYIISLLTQVDDAIKPLTELTPVYKIISQPFQGMHK
ncbi:MAG: hypothetical protein V1653_00510 [bacterium]